MMKFLTILLLVVSSFSYADVSGDGNVYYTRSFEHAYLNANGNNLNQVVTGYRNSCGPMSLLMANNYVSWYFSGQAAPFTNNSSEVKSALDRLYSYLGKRSNSITSVYNLNKIADERWGWNKHSILSTEISSLNTKSKMYNYLKTLLGNNNVLIVNLLPNSPLNSANIGHFVIIYEINDNNNMVKVFDPWDGSIKTTSKNNFFNSWVATAITLAVYP
ncbi:hypothetical protein [Pseudoalteromonas luteoviolacea]|uniref:Peptidase C39-like domain-containing protein n=1 Tax=Pseudoalteromonas luteoviolacea H33 TaxID=1365251 RepID=A0A167E4C6_9GAMM|nr:hypothetical protein [Pseudoalteromonas luteoviolacea]KZN50024.1 hypothetical protein N476_16895 [Pseudoalteromonas luteoviolacea H33]KZN76402.1 hypothetical protein N477_16990 [Pseudoalteromonas luteoviolacea H33-S]